MARRIDIVTPVEWADSIRDVLSKDPFNFGPQSKKPHMLIELSANDYKIFQLTVPGPTVSETLLELRKKGIGVTVGRVSLTSVDYLKPALNAPLSNFPDQFDKTKKVIPPPPSKPLKGLKAFQKIRKTSEEIYNEISASSNMNINTWLNLLGASVLAACGSLTANTIITIGAMLVSPLMGPILGMTLGYRISDYKLFKTSLINELKMAVTGFLVGAFIGLWIGELDTYKWPNASLVPDEYQYNLIISIIISTAAGWVVACGTTTAGGNPIVGAALGAGLLPPLVNAGMLIIYSAIYVGNEEDQRHFKKTAIHNVVFWFTHVVAIVISANIIFYLKKIHKNLRTNEDLQIEHFYTIQNQNNSYVNFLKTNNYDDNEHHKLLYILSNMSKDVKQNILKAYNYISGNSHDHSLPTDVTQINQEDNDEDNDEDNEEIVAEPNQGLEGIELGDIKSDSNSSYSDTLAI